VGAAGKIKIAGKVAQRLDCVGFSRAFGRMGTLQEMEGLRGRKSGAKAAAVQTLRANRPLPKVRFSADNWPGCFTFGAWAGHH
jgi:hypothetical protein